MLHNIKNLDQDNHYGAKNNNYSLNGWEKEKGGKNASTFLWKTYHCKNKDHRE